MIASIVRAHALTLLTVQSFIVAVGRHVYWYLVSLVMLSSLIVDGLRPGELALEIGLQSVPMIHGFSIQSNVGQNLAVSSSHPLARGAGIVSTRRVILSFSPSHSYVRRSPSCVRVALKSASQLLSGGRAAVN